MVRATAEDAPLLLEIQKTCFTPHLLRYRDYETSPATMGLEKLLWKIENRDYFKIIYGDMCVGAIEIAKVDGFGNYKLHTIYVLPEFQGKGIGQSAIKAL